MNDDIRVIDDVANLLVSIDEYQALLSVATPALALAVTIKLDTDTLPTASHCLIGAPSSDDDRTSADGWMTLYAIDVVLLIKPVVGEGVQAGYLRAVRLVSNLKRALKEHPNKLLRHIAGGAVVRMDASDELPLWLSSVLTLTFRGAP